MTYDPVSGKNWDYDAAVIAWQGSMQRVQQERTAPLRWQLDGLPVKNGGSGFFWAYWNFGPWRGEVRTRPDGFHWKTVSYDTGELLHSGVTTSLYECFQSVEQNRPVSPPG